MIKYILSLFAIIYSKAIPCTTDGEKLFLIPVLINTDGTAGLKANYSH
jgi:hypothetical protein